MDEYSAALSELSIAGKFRCSERYIDTFACHKPRPCIYNGNREALVVPSLTTGR